MIWFYILIFIGSCFLLVKSGAWVVRALTRMAQFLEWSEFLLSFFLMAFATSLPEFFVGLSSAFSGVPQLSFGNIIGANILNLTVGIGIAVLVAKGLDMRTEVVKRDVPITAMIAFLPLLLMLDGRVSRIDGIILLAVLAFYVKHIFHEKQQFTRTLKNKFKNDFSKFKLFLKDLGIFLGGITLLLLAGEGVVMSAKFLSVQAKLPLIITGIFLVSIGTTLPEIVFGLKSVALGHKEMVLGNFMGSVVINSTLILGLVSIISPLKVINFSPYVIGILFTVIVAILFSVFSTTKKKISAKEAIILIGIYILFIVFQTLIK